MFEPVRADIDFTEVEEEQLAFWRREDLLRQVEDARRDAEAWVFYEGPPTANGQPGLHHVLARVFKDAFPRYHTMKGRRVVRKGGWDTHGLPVELEVERQLELDGKPQIEEYGIAAFNAQCRESVFQYVEDWEALTDRIGFWIDMDDPYVTCANEYIESVWWILKTFWDDGLIYRDLKSVPFCPRCSTALSDHEVAQGYAQVDDPSITIRFRLKDEPGTSFLAWTTTPWTLPGNVALALHPEVSYVKVRLPNDGGDPGAEPETYIVAEESMSRVFGERHVDAEVVERWPGSELRGIKYEPLYTFTPLEKEAHYTITADFVTTETGTGIVHVAPAFGAEDLEAGREHDLPAVQPVTEEGRFTAEVTPWAGTFVKEADPEIIQDLDQRGLLFSHETYRHTYPFCWRCDTPLLYYARPTWYLRTRQFVDELLAGNAQINWVPDHIRDGRFGNWLANNVDWALARERYWGTPLPIWRCTACDEAVCVGSVEELARRADQRLDPGELDLHRPTVDELTLTCGCGGTMERIEEVLDVWFDSGAMPYAQWHYPFENEDVFADQFPADFICEAVDQTRGWFYSLHAIATLLKGEPSYKNVICLGLILDGEGVKMSKSRGNVVDPWQVIDEHGADAVRWYLYTASPPGNDRRFSQELVAESKRKFLMTLWNVYSFFSTYAALDAFEPAAEPVPLDRRPVLDRWILAELDAVSERVDDAMAAYDITGATRSLAAFVEILSNWYVRRSRRRFWRSRPADGGTDQDKLAAYQTLYEVLVTVSKLCAPCVPFISEAIYRGLVPGVDGDAPASVHLTSFPQPPDRFSSAQRQDLVEGARLARSLASVGRAAREQAGIRVRQPLRRAVVVASGRQRQLLEPWFDEVSLELNLKAVETAAGAEAFEAWHVRPVFARLGPRLGEKMPQLAARLEEGLADAAVARLQDGQAVEVALERSSVRLEADDVQLERTAREGWALAEDDGMVVGLETHIDEALRAEGLAREVVRRIQQLRKDADFHVSDRIQVRFEAEDRLRQAIQRHDQYIQRETLAVELVPGASADGWATAEDTIDGHGLTVAVRQVEA